MVNGIISFISLFELSLLVYRNATDFYVLILYLATLPNSLMSSSSFLVVSLGFSVYNIMLSANSDSLISSSTTWASFTVFFSLISMAWTSKTTLNKSKSGCTYLIPDLRGNTFSFSPLSMILAVGFLYMALMMLCFLYAHFLESIFLS